MSFALDPSARDCGLPAAVATELESALADLDEMLATDPDRAVHSARKHLKKARSAARLLRGGVADDERSEVNRLIRDAGRRLSDIRDATVKRKTIGDLTESERVGSGAARGLRGLSESLAPAPSAETLREAAALARSEIALARGQVLSWEPDRRGFKLLARGLEREYDRGRKAMTRVRSDPSDELVHAWRKRSKDLWYHHRLLAPAWPDGLAAAVEASHELSDLLGDHHDLAVLAADLDAAADLPERERRAALAALRERQRELLDGALSLGARLYAEKPRAYRRRMKALWRAAADA